MKPKMSREYEYKSAAEEYAEVPITGDSSRLRFPLGYLEHMPIKTVTLDELMELMTHWDYNPCYAYAAPSMDMSKFKFIKGERGHDQRYRYILEEE